MAIKQKIALAHDFMTVGGAENVLEHMHQLWPDATVYTLYRQDREVFRGWSVCTSIAQPFLSGKTYRFPFPLYPWLTNRLTKQLDPEIDLLLSSSVSYMKNVVMPPGVPHICYIHRAAMFAYDRQEMFLSGYPALARPLLRFFCNRFRKWDQRYAKNPDLYIANSRYVAAMVKRVYNADARVVYPGVDIQPFRAAGLATSPGEYYFCALRLEGYKRIDLIIEACNQLQLPLKIAGSGPYRGELEKIAGPTIEFLGFVPDEEMPGLFAGAKAFLFPSEEDFGIAPVESLAACRPVIALNKAGTAETVVHGVTGVHFAEQNMDDIMGAMLLAESIDWDADAIRESAIPFSTEVFKEKISKIVGKYLAE